MYIGKRIRELREGKGYTLDYVQSVTGIKKGTLSKYENSRSFPSGYNLNKLADFYNVSIDYLFGRDYTISAENEESYRIVVPKIDVKILKILHREENSAFLTYLREDPERRIKGLNNNYNYN